MDLDRIIRNNPMLRENREEFLAIIEAGFDILSAIEIMAVIHEEEFDDVEVL